MYATLLLHQWLSKWGLGTPRGSGSIARKSFGLFVVVVVVFVGGGGGGGGVTEKQYDYG